jgi:hypothetical protein
MAVSINKSHHQKTNNKMTTTSQASWEADARNWAEKWIARMPHFLPATVEELKMYEKQCFEAGYLIAKREETTQTFKSQ